jgi:hypothetical protein
VISAKRLPSCVTLYNVIDLSFAYLLLQENIEKLQSNKTDLQTPEQIEYKSSHPFF